MKNRKREISRKSDGEEEGKNEEVTRRRRKERTSHISMYSKEVPESGDKKWGKSH